MRTLNVAFVAFMALLFCGDFVEKAIAETENFQLEPSGAQITLFPGHSTTTGLLIKAGPSGVLRDRLLLSLADWEFTRMGSVVYKEAGTTKRSAAAWISIHPLSLPIAPGDAKLVRITIRVPDDIAPGVYTSALLVTEEIPQLSAPPAGSSTPPKVYCSFTVLITVRPQEVHK